jgi:ribosomal protein S18 acetylase RimI-like enzyme
LKIRPAKKTDKKEILSFCVNTFSWGDYIDRVWDYWFRTGRLLVVDDDGGRRVGMSHVAMCQGGRGIWLEGVRVHPGYRRSRIATRLLEKMIEYGRQKGAREASAIVDVTNVASQRMLEKNGFSVISRWAYYRVEGRPRRSKSDARLAAVGDLEDIWCYLQGSEIYNLSARRYVKSWHWYPLDRKTLRDFIKEKRVIATGRPVDGVAVIDRRGYWDKTNILQIVYLDAASDRALGHLVSFVTNVYLDGGFEGLQLVCHDSRRLTSFVEKFMIKDEEQFLLYDKVFRARSTHPR